MTPTNLTVPLVASLAWMASVMTSDPAAELTVVVPDAIAVVGESVTLVANSDGVSPFRYQWKKNGEPIEGVTGDTLIINSAQVTDAATYVCVVANDYGSQTSPPFWLVVNAPE